MIVDNHPGAVKVRGRRLGRLIRILNPVRLGKDAEDFFHATRRRQGWFIENLSPRKLMNMLNAGASFALKREKMASWPVVVKIDISPLCNLACTVCVHADANGNPALEKQQFGGKQRMTVEQYRRIVDEIKGKSTAVSLYYLGDPIVHPDLDEMSGIARDAGLNVHISTNFCVPLSDARIRRIVTSGLTHLSVCVDGLSQEKYELTRVGGRIDRVLSNLKRVCEHREELGQLYPQIEVQYIKFRHNLDELDEARRVLTEMGVNQVTDFWGQLDNYTDHDPGTFAVVGPKKNQRLPQCHWPHFAMVIKYNGDVIPCCTYRLGQQYTNTDDPRILGNVFKTSVRDVWNAMPYRQARRFVSNPQAIKSDASLESHFCQGCSRIFHTDKAKRHRPRSTRSFEELYTIGVNNRPVRRDASVAAGACASAD